MNFVTIGPLRVHFKFVQIPLHIQLHMKLTAVMRRGRKIRPQK